MHKHALAKVRKYFPNVTSVADAKSEAIITVTSRDINSSAVRKHDSCALAVAARGHFVADGVIVAVATAYVIKGKKAMRFRLPESVSREIVAFDRNGAFEPGQYKLLKPSGAHALGAHYGGNSTSNGHGKKKAVFKHFTGGIRTVLGSKDIS